MAKPLVAVETIYETALQVLENEGVEGLSARRLAATLGCSTRTLYQQVGKREELVRQLLDYQFANTSLEFRREAHWEEAAVSWANAMRAVLLAHTVAGSVFVTRLGKLVSRTTRTAPPA